MSASMSVASNEMPEKAGVVMIENAEDAGVLDTIEDTKPGAFVWLCAAATAIGGMLFGCKQSIQSAHVLIKLTSS